MTGLSWAVRSRTVPGITEDVGDRPRRSRMSRATAPLSNTLWANLGSGSRLGSRSFLFGPTCDCASYTSLDLDWISGTSTPSPTTNRTTIHAYRRKPHAHVAITSLVLSMSPPPPGAGSAWAPAGHRAGNGVAHAVTDEALPGGRHV